MTIEQSVDEARESGEGERILAAAQALQPAIRAAAERIEQGRTLPPDVVEGMRDAGVFRMSTPRAWGGPELDPMEQFAVIEALSIADGSVGWCAYINSTSGHFTAFLDDDVARAMYPSLDIPTGGMPVPVGRAEIVDGGYRISGRWTFGSGVAHCGWMVCGCVVHEDGVPRKRADGSPEAVVTFVAAEDFDVIDTWNAMGLRGSGSHDFAVEGLFVPRERTFDMNHSPIRRTTPLYGMRTIYLFNHAPIALGIARAAIDEFVAIACAKRTQWGPLGEQDYARTALARAEATVRSARAYCLEVLADAYATLAAGEELSLDQRAHYRLAITHAHRAAVEAIDGVFQAAGTTPAVRLPSVLERCFRDVHVANQHMIANPRTYVETGAMLLGAAPNDSTY